MTPTTGVPLVEFQTFENCVALLESKNNCSAVTSPITTQFAPLAPTTSANIGTTATSTTNIHALKDVLNADLKVTKIKLKTWINSMTKDITILMVGYPLVYNCKFNSGLLTTM